MKKIFVFGNEFLEYDSFAKEIAKQIKEEVNVVFCNSPDHLLDVKEKEILILDVVKGLKEPVLITDPEKLKTRGLISLHDFDLGFFLNLMHRLEIKKNIKIIGVPQNGNKAEIAKKVRELI